MSPASEILCSFVLDRSVNDSLPLRAKLLRALASTMPETSARFKEFTALADELEHFDERCRQLRFDLGDDKPRGSTSDGISLT